MLRLVLPLIAALVLALPVAAQQNQLGPESYAPALAVYADGLREERAALVKCSTTTTNDDAGWSLTRDIFLATLWANGYATEFVRDLETKLTADWPDGIDCADERVALVLRGPSLSAWPGRITRMLQNIGLTVVQRPVSAAEWDEIKAVFAREVPLEAALIACLAVTDPTRVPAEFQVWNEALVKTGQSLVLRGLPRDEVVALVSSAEAKAIWSPGTDRAAVLARCDGDPAWQNRYALLQQLTLSNDVGKILDREPSP